MKNNRNTLMALRLFILFIILIFTPLLITIYTNNILIGITVGDPVNSIILLTLLLLETKKIETKKIESKKCWAKIEDKSDGPLSWTEYTDHNGYVYTIYDMMTAPPTPGAYMKLDKDSEDENTIS